MQKIKRIGALSATILAAMAFSGCAVTRTQSVTGTAATGFTTNTVTTVNQGNLAIDAAAAQVATAVAVTATLNATHNDPNVVNALKNAQVALGGILNGTTAQTTQQVIEILKAQGNSALEQQVTTLVSALSAAEQQLLAKYGSSVDGQITLALTQAVYSGLTVGLNGR